MKQLDDKNKRIPGKKAVLALMLAGMLVCNTASAASKSTSVQVSCSVGPMMQMAANSSVMPLSNLQMSESLADRGSQKIKLYSFTAL